MTGIYLDQDQADDLCELLGHIHTVAWWLLFASDQITGDLAQAAYPAHFHPPSAVFWLTEDLIHIGDRLHQAIHPDNDNSDQPSGTNRRNPAAQAGTSSTAPSRDELDNSTPIGNHKPAIGVCQGAGPHLTFWTEPGAWPEPDNLRAVSLVEGTVLVRSESAGRVWVVLPARLP
jgi:hypothetical protein